ncbi:glycosyltransferase [Planctomonas psychrotolerans]|uniref:glycosyltransferase n=1 Tax=Planctomonas psychrotolerans TaxID=2528712 RepID=UPI001238B72A|nr:glycosyltransferase [Planctomonas psychrotolerans]
MRPKVTAILVAHNAAEYLSATLGALSAQTRPPDAVIAVDLGSTDTSADLLAAYDPTHLVAVPASSTFGSAVAAAVRVATPPASPNEWLWLLSADNAPEADALAELLGAVEIAPSVAVAGPKLMEHRNVARIHEFGETMTTLGASVPIVEGELDQAQHDGLSDVLAVAAGGMLVRHSLWLELGGFDDGLNAVDDALDFCVRARLAGHRVQLVPSARLLSAGERAPGTDHLGAATTRRKRRRLARTAQLYRRLVYAPALAVPLHWLSLLPLAILRSFMQLVRKQPTAVPGEITAALSVAVAGRQIVAARRRLARTRSAGWASIAPLRQPLDEGRRRRMLARDQYRALHQVHAEGIQFLSTGGAWTVLAAIVLAAVLFAPLLGAVSLAGGPLLPLSPTVGDLWSNVGYGYIESGLGIVGPADPFTYVLAVLGTITFWAPSTSIVYVFVGALPLAALGSWLCASRITPHGWLRAVAAVLWTLSPPFLAALESGRLAAVLVHLLLPWLFFAGVAASRSWSASAATAILLAATGASAPFLIPALLLLWLAALISSGRRLVRHIAVPLPLVVLFAPLAWYHGERGNWLAVFADPGVPTAFRPPADWTLGLGFPTSDLGHWPRLVGADGLFGVPPAVVVTVLVAPLILIALSALFLPHPRRGVWAIAVAVLGFATATFALRFTATSVGPDVIPVWPGAGLSLLWLGLIGAAVFAMTALGRFALGPALIATGTLTIVAVPLLLAPAVGTSVVRAGEGRTLPAYVTAEAVTRPDIATLVLQPERDGGVRADLVRGVGPVLDNQTTLATTATDPTVRDRRLATLAANLASRSGFDASEELTALQIGFVLLEEGSVGEGVDPAELDSTEARAASALDENALLTRVGDTSAGVLWRYPVVNDASPVAIETEPDNLDTPTGVGILAAQALVFGLTLLIAIPTGGLAASSRPLPEVRRRRVDTDIGESPDAPRPEDADITLDSYVDEPTGQTVEVEEIGDIPQIDDDVPSAADADMRRNDV